MPETNTGGSSNLGQPPKELSMELRLLLAFLLMGAVMFVTPFFYKNPPSPAANAVSTGGAVPATETAGAGAGAAAAATPAESTTDGTVPATPATSQRELPPLVIDTNLYRVTFSNQGGTVRSWLLKDTPAKKFRGNDGKQLDLVNTAANTPTPLVAYPFSLYIPNNDPLAQKVNWAWFTQTPDPNGLGVSFDYSDGHTSVKKHFQFQKNSYLTEVSTELSTDGHPVHHLISWRGGFGDLTVNNPSGNSKSLYFDIQANKLVERTARDALKNGPVTSTGNFSFAGIADTYFAAVFLPQEGDAMQSVVFADKVPTAFDKTPQPFTGTAVGTSDVNQFQLFVGPKDVDLLKSINPKLEQVVDFGWLSVLAKPLFLLVNWFNDRTVHNFGWSIVLITIAINLILFPLKFSNMKSMRKMQALKPQIDIINAKYKNIKMTDPRAGEKNQEVMDLYKKHGVNPMGGCFPMLLQLPFFFAFYKVFTVSVEMRGAPWLWVTDLSQPETIPIRILPLVMIVTQFLMQKMTPQANTDPSQQKMMQFMPLIFGFMFYKFPSGLVLYYLTSNLVQMGQQWFFNHTEAAVEAARSVGPPPKKKNGRK